VVVFSLSRKIEKGRQRASRNIHEFIDSILKQFH
jgi:hypothetical protein